MKNIVSKNKVFKLHGDTPKYLSHKLDSFRRFHSLPIKNLTILILVHERKLGSLPLSDTSKKKKACTCVTNHCEATEHVLV